MDNKNDAILNKENLPNFECTRHMNFAKEKEKKRKENFLAYFRKMALFI